ncbi:MAG: ATP synthase F1 subunit gamma [Planctomycetota bacterium]
MLSTRKIKRKIRSIQNIKKITRAMEMVSAAKFKRIWQKLSAIRPYSSKLKQMTENLLAHLKDIGFNHPYLTQSKNQIESHKTSKNQTLCVIAISSNKGLCGGYNTNIIKALSNFLISIETEKAIEIVPIGKKSLDFAQKRNFKMRNMAIIPSDINITVAQEMIKPVIKDYEQGLLNEVWLVYSEFINPMVNRPKAQRFLPFVADDAQRSTLNAPHSTQDYLFEPEPSELLNLIIPRYLEVIFYRTLLEAYASEHSARMIAMRNASKNASEVIKEMTLTFNKARQASITRELLDIVGGAEGLK